MRRSAGVPGARRLSITPLIDVTFLLLVFFLCTMRFKTLERKVAAYLPPTVGDRRTVGPTIDEPWIRVLLQRRRGEARTRVRCLDAELGAGESAFRELRRRVAAIHARAPEFQGAIDALAEVPHGDVVRTIDAFLAAGIHEIRFPGTPAPGRPSRAR